MNDNVTLSKEEYEDLLKYSNKAKSREKKPYVLVEPYTKDELVKLEKAFMTSKDYADNLAGNYLRNRDYFILTTAIALGTRPAETLNLRWSNIDWDKCEIMVSPYSNKERNATPLIMSRAAKNLLLSWRDVFDQHLKSDFVFPSLFTFEPMSTSGYAKRLRTISKEAGILKDVWSSANGQPLSNKRFYSARKTFGTEIYRKTKDPVILQRALRHRGMHSLNKYITPSNKEVKDVLDSTFG